MKDDDLLDLIAQVTIRMLKNIKHKNSLAGRHVVTKLMAKSGKNRKLIKK